MHDIKLGFAYGFLSLLRAEPGNCEPVMLPLAVSFLLDNARKGLDIPMEQYGHQDLNRKVHWRTCVHALNIIRLLLLDAALGHDMVNTSDNSPILASINLLTQLHHNSRHQRMDIYPRQPL